MEQSKKQRRAVEEEGREMGHVAPIHMQVIKIKREIEIEKLTCPAIEQHDDVRRVLRRHRSRSPLGLAHRERPISVGN